VAYEMRAGTFFGKSRLTSDLWTDLGIRCMTRALPGVGRRAHCPAHDGEGDGSGVDGARSRVE
jgi:hypothetical protein